MDNLTRYFAFFVGPILVYITITLYLKDRESLLKDARKSLNAGEINREEEAFRNEDTIGADLERFSLNKDQHEGKSYDLEATKTGIKKQEIIVDSQNVKKEEQSTKSSLRKVKSLNSHNFAEDFSFDNIDDFLQPEVDNSRFDENYQSENSFSEKPEEKSVLERLKHSKMNQDNSDNKASSFRSKKQKSISNNPIRVNQEPNTKWCYKKRIRLLILVFTHPGRSYERLIARKTWIRYTPSDFAMFFVMGKPDDDLVADIEDELAQFQDILVGNFKDQKRSETTKFMMALLWFSQLQNVCKVPRYVLKTADNIYINMAALSYWIKNELPVTKNVYLGRVVRKDEPVRNRNNPRYVPRSAFQDFVFPDYLNGPQYLFSADVMHRMAYVTRLVFPIAVEDAYIGLLCHRLEISPRSDENFHLLMKTTNVCVNAKLLFIFCKSAKEMSKLHKENRNSNKLLQCKPLPQRGSHVGL